ncbi:MAG: hypothetical protein JRH20_31860, partial [Deltaproteobacteria bacterium]|nr:hypothetical protein [Deltaproteobacteria bacterium]
MSKLLEMGLRVTFALALLSACTVEQPTSLRVTVTHDLGTRIDQLHISIVPHELVDQRTPKNLTHARGAAIMSGHRVVMLLKDTWGGHIADLMVVGLSAGQPIAQGYTEAMVITHDVVDINLSLCADACPRGDSKCVNNGSARCTVNTDGCLAWSLPIPCPQDTPFCSNGNCADACQDECRTEERRCVLGGYEVCGEHDEDDCSDWGGMLSCRDEELCIAGECLPNCGGSPCACSPGETSVCDDIGECRGGARRCIEGSYGRCEWSAGPSMEICDGKDNDCNGTIDDADKLPAEACAEQAGVCQGATKTCAGTSGWLPCDAATYAAQAAINGAVYEPVETRCDTKDNDCNNRTDEPASCCQISCDSKACGEPDGCGGRCQTGNCPDNATCDQGSCICNVLTCGATCCATGQVCRGNACCTPNCSGRVCGLDPQCQTSCGSCSAGTCDEGLCVTASCTAAGPVTLDATGHVGMDTSLALDKNDTIHISYYDSTNDDLKYATNASGAWVTTALDSTGDVGNYTSLAVDSSDKVHVCYYDSTNDDLKYATNTSGSWAFATVDAMGSVGMFTSLAVDKNDKVHISYLDFTNDDLKYATNASGSWVTTTLDAAGDVGWHSSLGTDSNGKVHI